MGQNICNFDWEANTQLLDNIDHNTLSILIEFLQPSRKLQMSWSSHSSPLSTVPIWYKKLERHLHPSTTDLDGLSQLKSNALQCLVQKFEVKPLHKVAVFLHPRTKGLKVFTEDERQEVYQETSKLVSVQEKTIPAMNLQLLSSATQPPLPKEKTKLSHIDFEDSDSECDGDEDEVKYIALKLTKNENVQLLEWWRNHKHEFPLLSSCTIYAFHTCIQCTLRESLWLNNKWDAYFTEARNCRRLNVFNQQYFKGNQLFRGRHLRWSPRADGRHSMGSWLLLL